MSSDDTISAYIIDTQIAIFEDARLDLQMTIKDIADHARLPKTTVDAWAQGRNAISLWGVKKLLRVKGMAPFLSRLFEPEDHALVRIPAEIDHAAIAGGMSDYLAAKHDAHHPESEAGPAIGPNEDNVLRGKFARVKAA